MNSNKHLIEFLLDKSAIQKKDNVIFAEKAFVFNALIKWCLKQNVEIQKQLFLDGVVESFVAGKVNIKIKDDKLKIQEINLNERIQV